VHQKVRQTRRQQNEKRGKKTIFHTQKFLQQQKTSENGELLLSTRISFWFWVKTNKLLQRFANWSGADHDDVSATPVRTRIHRAPDQRHDHGELAGEIAALRNMR
jgi:hypothetical protein